MNAPNWLLVLLHPGSWFQDRPYSQTTDRRLAMSCSIFKFRDSDGRIVHLGHIPLLISSMARECEGTRGARATIIRARRQMKRDLFGS